MLAAVVPVDYHRRLARRPGRDRAGHHANLRALLLDAEGQRVPRVGQQRQRLGVVGVDRADLARGEEIAEQRA